MICGAPSGVGRIAGMSDTGNASPSSDRSVTLWLEQLQAGDSAAAQQLLQRYAELAAQLNMSLRAVERKLQLIRRQWSQELEP